MEYGSVEREIYVDASPELVFEVVSQPEHISQWWTDDAAFDPLPGATGELVFGDRETVVQMSVVEVDPPRLFSFRWCYGDAEIDASSRSLLVRFELTPRGAGTSIRLLETGFREMGWELATARQRHQDHDIGWGRFVPQLGEYIAQLAGTR